MTYTKNTKTSTNSSIKNTSSNFSNRLVQRLSVPLNRFVKLLSSKLPTGEVAARSGLSQRTIQRLRKSGTF